MTKTNFFKIMRESRVTAGATVKEMTPVNGSVDVFVNQPSAPNASIARHKVGTGAYELAKLNYTKWLADWFLNLPALVEADHEEALRMDALMFPVETAHAEALVMDEAFDLVATVKTYGQAWIAYFMSDEQKLAYRAAARVWLAMHAEALLIDDSLKVIYTRPGIMDADIWSDCEAADRTAALMLAHAEALRINSRRRVAEFFGGLDHAGRVAKVDAAHAEALVMNAERRTTLADV